nr:polysaccharide biosynthesis C-terminal domain-containing protein [uncultured Capnocytophaga sp.]
MGIVLRQSFKNVIATYLGFAIGALNTLFLFTYFLSKSEYGLVSYVTSTATILSPLIAFGVHNTLIRYYTAYQDKKEQARFSLMLCFLPLLVIIPATLVGVSCYEEIAQWLSAKNAEVRPYVLLIFLTSVVMAYFEMAYAWARVQLKTVWGNFLKEVFHRVGVMFLLLAVYLQCINFEQLMWGVFWVYALRMLLMFISAFYVHRPQLVWGLPTNKKDVFLYSLFVILSGSVASVLMDIDKFMLNQYLPIGEIAVYNVAIFTATVIAIPYRSMYQIVSPMTAQFMNQNKSEELSDLYKRSTINTYFVSMVICVLIIVNAQQYYALLPNKDYNMGLMVLIIVSVVKLSDALVGFSNAVLLNSPYYRTVLFLGVFLVIGTVLMNMWLIPLYGINGAGFATLLAFTSYNLLKSGFVYHKYGLQPFYKETFRTTLFGIVSIGGFFFWDFSFHPLVNIGLKSLLVVGVSVFFLLKLNLSEELIKLIRRFGKG